MIISDIRSNTQYRILFFLFILTITRKSQTSFYKKKILQNILYGQVHTRLFVQMPLVFDKYVHIKKYIQMHRCTNR